METARSEGKIRTIDYKQGELYLVDQTALPGRFQIVRLKRAESIAVAIETMVVRGAPAIGVTAALGLAIGLKTSRTRKTDSLKKHFLELCARFARTRPTAVNLFWAINKMKAKFESVQDLTREQILIEMESEAVRILNNDIEVNKRMGEFGSSLIKDNATVMTICNAGALATVAYGTALSVVRFAYWKGTPFKVIASETRPRMQGASLTAWEMVEESIPCQVISDNMAGFFMSKGKVDVVIVGADRIARNGDTANKIGTYSMAILAKEHNIPFYIAAPLSTFDFDAKSGDDINIEFRDPKELSVIQGKQVYPDGVTLENPAFDVTPFKYIHGFITERGIVSSPEILLKK